MEYKKIYEGDHGTTFYLDCGVDITSSSVRKILFRRPDGSVGEWSALFDPNRPTEVFYRATGDDLDQPGRWLIQTYVEMPTGIWKGRTCGVMVHGDFE